MKVRSQKSEVRSQLAVVSYQLTVLFLLFTASCLLFAGITYAGLRGLPEGKSRVQAGDMAPLDTADLKKAHEEGKVILLMFGNVDHCIYCEKVWGNVRDLMERYGKDAVGILKTHRASKFWAPEDEAVALGEKYGVVGEPWLFVIDRKGVVTHIFLGLVGKTEIENELKKALEQK